MPKVSILLTSYNHEKFLLESINSILNQTFKDFELYIVDDCSTDSSWDIIQSIEDDRVIKIRNPKNLGEPVSADFFKSLKGEYYAIAHCDDKWAPSKLEKQVAYLDAHPEIGVVFTNVELIDQNGNRITDTSHPYYRVFYEINQSRYEWLRTFFDTGNHLCHPSSLTRTKIRVDEDIFVYGLASFPDLWRWIKICLHHEIYILDEKLTYFRVHYDQSNASGINPSNMVRVQTENMLIAKEFFKIPSNDFLKVFPEAEKYVVDGDIDTRYVLSRMMIENKNTGFQACGIQELYSLLNEETSRKRIEKLYGFGPADFKQITSRKDIFHNLKEDDYLHISLYYWTGNNFQLSQCLTKKVYAGASFVAQFDLSQMEYDKLRLDLDEGVYRKFIDLSLKMDDTSIDYKIVGQYESEDNSILFYTTDPQIYPKTNKGTIFTVSGKTEKIDMGQVQMYLDNKSTNPAYRIIYKVLRKIRRRK